VHRSTCNLLRFIAAALCVLIAAASSGCGGVVVVDPGPRASESASGAAARACPTMPWGRGFAEGYPYEYGESIAADRDCNVVVSGSFGGTLDVGGASLAGQDEDVFLAKLDGDGQHLWSKHFGVEPFQGSAYVAVDAVGNIVLTGTFSGTIDFGSGGFIAPKQGIYVAKLDPDGRHVWSHVFGGAFDTVASAVAVDASGAALLGGYFTGTLDFGTGPLGASGSRSAYVTKLDPGGNVRWAIAFPGYGARSTAVTFDAHGDALVAGVFQQKLQVGPFALSGQGGHVPFVAKLGHHGEVRYARAFAGTGTRVAAGVAADRDGNAVVLGSFDNTIDFGAGPLATAGHYDGFLVSLDASGMPRWAETFGGMGSESIYGIASDAADNLVVTGAFSGTMQLGGVALHSAGSADGFVAGFDRTGAVRFGRRFGGPFGQADTGMSVATDPAGNAIVTGVYQGTADFGSGSVTSAGGFDVFVAKFVP
jgi:hypothetical protein